MPNQFLLPDVGEGLTEAEIVEWRVKVGDEVALNQVVVEIETAKSLVELPSPFEGTVTRLLVEAGQVAAVGQAIIEIGGAAAEDANGAGSGEASSPTPRPATPRAAEPAREQTQQPSDQSAAIETPAAEAPAGEVERDATAAAAAAKADAGEGSGSVLVGYGTSAGAKTRRTPKTRSAATTAPAALPVTPGQVLAKPPIRKLAKDLGVDLASIEATGARGEVTREDVVRAAEVPSVFRNLETPRELPEEREERIAVKGVRKAIAEAMVRSTFESPHVSLFVDVDATRTMEYVKRLKASTTFADTRVSPLLVMSKAIIWAIRRNPMVNAKWADTEIIKRNYVNLGIAAATPRGLIVPNIKDADRLSMIDLAKAIQELTYTARDGKTTPEAQREGTITITNIGVFGMDTGTPILNPGEVAIVALGTIKQKPWVVNGEIMPRYVTTLGASFDHRVVDGDVASRFLADVASVLEEPALLLD